jgi:hypothetical protein
MRAPTSAKFSFNSEATAERRCGETRQPVSPPSFREVVRIWQLRDAAGIAKLIALLFLIGDELAETEPEEDHETQTHSEQPMQEEQIREALNKHWQASAAGDADAEHDIYDDDAICDYPQSGERILGRNNLQALRSHHPGKPSGFSVKRILGKGDLWITEYTIIYQGRPAFTVSIMEFRDGKVVHETQYFADPFEAPAWRTQWVQPIA